MSQVAPQQFSTILRLYDSTPKWLEPKWVYVIVSFFTECPKISQNLMVDHQFPHFAHERLVRSPHLHSQIQRFFSKWTKSGTSNSWTRRCSCFTSYGRGQLVSCVTVVKWVNENCMSKWFTSLAKSTLPLKLSGVVLKPVVQNRRLGMALDNPASGTKGVTVRWFKRFPGMFEYQISHLLGMPRK